MVFTDASMTRDYSIAYVAHAQFTARLAFTRLR
jgi:hypothetical protein